MDTPIPKSTGEGPAAQLGIIQRYDTNEFAKSRTGQDDGSTSVDPLEFSVRGSIPGVSNSPYEGSQEQRWRRKIEGGVRERNPQPFEFPVETRFRVEVLFRLAKERLTAMSTQPAPPDLDNLLKPLLDTVFTSDNVTKKPTGVLVNANDNWVFDVHASKTLAHSTADEGVDVIVTWQ